MMLLSTWRLWVVSLVAVGVQYGWAVQFCNLTPHVQLLGVDEKYLPAVWLCGPLSGLLAQPLFQLIVERFVTFRRRKPYLVIGTFVSCVGLLMMGFAEDMGVKFGDNYQNDTQPRGAMFLILGAWILDLGNNVIQDAARAFLVDLSGNNHRKIRKGNAIFTFFMGLGNILGYGSMAFDEVQHIVPFIITKDCTETSETICGILKGSCIINTVIMVISMIIVVFTVPEPDLQQEANQESCIARLRTALHNMTIPVWIIFIVTALNWVALWPLMSQTTDWVAKDIYGADPKHPTAVRIYALGVREGALMLMVMSVGVACLSLLIDPIANRIGGMRRLWGIFNIIMGIGIVMTAPITKMAQHSRGSSRGLWIVAKSFLWGCFVIMGCPLAVTYTVPFTLASVYSAETTHGSLGLLNCFVVLPQLLMTAITGPLNDAFGSNLPVFQFGAIVAFISGIIALGALPPPQSNI